MAEADPPIEIAGLPGDAFAGQVAVITGAGQGIGRQVARTLAHLGASVVLAEVAAEAGAETQAAIRAEEGSALFVQTDVSDAQSVAELARRAEEAFGPTSILVNNAALEPVAKVTEMPIDAWDRVMGANLRGTFLTCKALLPAMLAKGGGTIVNMVSLEAMPGLSAYIASKQGIVGFSQSLAAEVGPQGVRVIAFAPGMVDTPGLRGAADGLAPLVGLSREQFMALSLHPAYDGLMPVSHAAAATAYLLARLADEYHGEVTNGYAVLERAGLIMPGGLAAAAVRPPPAPPPAAPVPRELGSYVNRALTLAEQLQSTLMETEAEFERLPVFVRPMARGGFKSRVGYRVQDVIRAQVKLLEQLGRLQTSHSGVDTEFQVDYPRLAAVYERLITYYDSVPAETARFTKDSATLQQLREQMDRRIALIRDLCGVLDDLHR